MNRPSEKLLKDMSKEELAIESEWHERESAKLFDEVKEMRDAALEMNEQGSEETLQAAAALEADAEAHLHQSNLLDMLRASRLSEQGVGQAKNAAKA